MLSICLWFFNVSIWNSFWKLKLKAIFVFHLSDYASQIILMEVKELKECAAVRHPGRYPVTLIHVHVQQIIVENFVQLCQ